MIILLAQTLLFIYCICVLMRGLENSELSVVELV